MKNKPDVDLSELVAGNSTVIIVWEGEIYRGKYLGPAEEGYFTVEFEASGEIHEIDPDIVIKILKPEKRWD